MLNRCAHRGNLVCLKERGHTKDGLTCVYHAWRYDLAGNLTSVAFRRGVGGKGGMPDSFKLEEHGLKKLRTDQFAGLVFGTLSPEAPPLADYIGNLIGSRIGRVFRGKPKILGTTSQILHNNWKLYVENVKDTYHASLLHTFFTTFRLSRLTTKGGVAIAESGGNHASYTYGAQRGDDAESDQAYGQIHSLHEDYKLQDPRFLDSVDEIGDGVTLQILSVFPNFVLQQIHNSIAVRLVLPKGPDQTELLWTYLGFEDDDADDDRAPAAAGQSGRPGRLCLDGGRRGRRLRAARDQGRRGRMLGPGDGRVRARLAGDAHDRSLGARLLACLSRHDGAVARWTSRRSGAGSNSTISTPPTPPVSIPTRWRAGRNSSPRIAATASPRPRITRPACRSG